MIDLSSLIISLKRPYHFARGVLAYLLNGMMFPKLVMIGVTGTDGKTSTSTYLYEMMRKEGLRVALITTVAAYLGQEKLDTGFHVTTPNPFKLFKLIRTIEKKGYTHLVLETTSHGIHQHRVFGVRPKVTILTNITPEHLDYHRTYDRYLAVKASFIARATDVAIINKADSSFQAVRSYLRKLGTTFVGYDLSSADADLRSALRHSNLPRYTQQNLLAAATAAMRVGVSLNTCLTVIRKPPLIDGRAELVQEKPFRVVVDFAHTPNALEQALKGFRSSMKSGARLIAVFGAAGERDPFKRPAMGRVASELADIAVITAEDPRSEKVEHITRQIKDGVVGNHGHMHEIADRKEAIMFALNVLAKPDDCVVIFGKGHEQSMNLDGKSEQAWSDVGIAKEILNEGRA